MKNGSEAFLNWLKLENKEEEEEEDDEAQLERDQYTIP